MVLFKHFSRNPIDNINNKELYSFHVKLSTTLVFRKYLRFDSCRCVCEILFSTLIYFVISNTVVHLFVVQLHFLYRLQFYARLTLPLLWHKINVVFLSLQLGFYSFVCPVFVTTVVQLRATELYYLMFFFSFENHWKLDFLLSFDLSLLSQYSC